jgi:galactokinase
MACSLCEPGRALFLDIRSLCSEQLLLPRKIELLIIHSGVSHSHAEHGQDEEPAPGSYRVRRAECERAAQLLGVKSLRDLEPPAAGLRRAAGLPPPLDRRVRHVLTENERVRAAVEVLRRGAEYEEDLAVLGALFYESHRSQRDDYAVSVPAVDLLADIGANDPAIINGGARLTGGGFGGSVVMLAREGTARAAGTRITARYRKESGLTPIILSPL